MPVLRLAGVFLLAFMLLTPTASGSEDRTAKALDAAESWLALVDAGDYGQSWDTAAAFFRGTITRSQWEDLLTTVRSPLGKVLSRKFLTQTYLTEIPGAPDGHYVILQFETAFENKRNSVETVTPMLDPDGTWRVSGYYIK